LLLCWVPLACGSGGGAPAAGDNSIGPVDLTQAPASLAMTCAGTGSLAFEMPCLMGFDLFGQDTNAAGVHATECRLAAPSRPIVWSFLFPLAAVRADPTMPLQTSGLQAEPGTEQAILLQGEAAMISSVKADLTFSRVDPTNRAFIGRFTGSVVWTSASGTQTPCQIDGPFWGGPGNFL
jgi:hypothetical protein